MYQTLCRYVCIVDNNVPSPFDSNAAAVSGKNVNTPIELLSFLQLHVLSRSAIVVLLKLLFVFVCWQRGFCHRTSSDLFLFLLIFDLMYTYCVYILVEVSFCILTTW